MAYAWVVQYAGIAVVNNVPTQAPLGPPLRSERVSFTDSQGDSAAIGDDCGLVMLYVDTPACWAGGDEPVPTTSDAPIGAGIPFYMVPTGQHAFSFITQDAE